MGTPVRDQREKVPDRRGTGERYHVRAALPIFHQSSQTGARGCWGYGFVGLHNIDFCAQFPKFARDHIAGDFSARQQDTFPSYLLAQTFNNGFGDIFFGDDGDSQSSLFDSFLRRRADGGDFEVMQALFGEMKFFQSIPDGIDSVHAGEDEPVVGGQILEGGIQRPVRARLADFYEGNLQDIGAEFPQARRQCARLVPRPADQNAKAV